MFAGGILPPPPCFCGCISIERIWRFVHAYVFDSKGRRNIVFVQMPRMGVRVADKSVSGSQLSVVSKDRKSESEYWCEQNWS